MKSADTDTIGPAVLSIIHAICRRPVELAAHSAFAGDLGFDSLQTLEFVAALEDRFGITVPIDQVPRIQTVGEAVACVQTLLAQDARF